MVCYKLFSSLDSGDVIYFASTSSLIERGRDKQAAPFKSRHGVAQVDQPPSTKYERHLRLVHVQLTCILHVRIRINFYLHLVLRL